MLRHTDITDVDLRKRIRQREILLAGNLKLHIYGLLGCASGKRMKKANRVFFSSLRCAVANGFRPCAHCMHVDYAKWKNGSI